jgi:hypothetical protein
MRIRSERRRQPQSAAVLFELVAIVVAPAVRIASFAGLDPPVLRGISHLDNQILVELFVQIRRAVAPWIAQYMRALDRFVVAGAMRMTVNP